jgi:peptidoglycan/xylan/chitin deacetylase (PgdA/CDA1 family)
MAVLLTGVIGLTGCVQSVNPANPVNTGAPADPVERLDKKSARKVRPHDGPSADTADSADLADTYRRWGLPAPLARPPKPSAKAPVRAAGPGLPPVVDRVPTRDKVVFLTFDDGAEKDPRFVDMVRELRLPVSMFLTDSVVGPGYAHFGRLRAVGASVQNHTLDHPYLPGLPYVGQRAEICGQQEKLKERFGIRPRLFRPPYGDYNDDTLRAAADCGVAAVVLWREPDHLRPGDILHCPEGQDGASLAETTIRILTRIQKQGFTVARLEDYL